MNNKPYSLIFRLMHWSMALVFVLLLITILLRITWLEKTHVAGIIAPFLETNGTQLSEEQIIVLAKQIRKPMWDWHIYLGYVLVGLFSIRLLLPINGLMPFRSPLQHGLTKKEKIHRWTYLLFYLCVAVSLTTGMLMEFGPESTEELAEEIHKPSIYYLVSYMVLHLGGVLWAEFTIDKGIISRVISGEKQDLQP